MKALLFGILVILSFTIVCCSRNFNSKKIVENKSAHNLKIVLYGGKISQGSWKTSDSFYIKPNSRATIVNLTSSAGTFYREGQCARSDMDSLAVEVIDNPALKITKDFSINANWTSNKGAGSHKTEIECRATITDADIVPK